jgi:hypothetical protein
VGRSKFKGGHAHAQALLEALVAGGTLTKQAKRARRGMGHHCFLARPWTTSAANAVRRALIECRYLSAVFRCFNDFDPDQFHYSNHGRLVHGLNSETPVTRTSSVFRVTKVRPW